jgi:voltage-gated potassium channel
MQTIQTFRQYVYSILEEQEGGLLGTVINTGLIILIIANVLVVVFESEKSFVHDFHDALLIFEYVSLAVFGTEYLLRLWVAPENPANKERTPLRQRLRYSVTPMAIIDFMAIMPMLLGFFFSDNLLMLRMFRLIRGFKITRYSRSMSLLVVVLKHEAGTILSTFFILGILIVLAATGIYLVEGDVQPEHFGSIPKALWWATVTLTTIGYGDVVPITIYGRLFGGLIAILGITMAALPAGILASGFSTELNRRRDVYRYHASKFLGEGEIKLSQVRKLDRKRNELGISRSDAQLILYELKQEVRISSEVTCPHCKNKIYVSHPPGVVKVTT